MVYRCILCLKLKASDLLYTHEVDYYFVAQEIAVDRFRVVEPNSIFYTTVYIRRMMTVIAD